MTAETINRSTHRLDFLAHHDACRPCSSLYTFARERNHLGALTSWRKQVAAHLANDAERRDFDRLVRQQLIGRETRCRP